MMRRLWKLINANCAENTGLEPVKRVTVMSVFETGAIPLCELSKEKCVAVRNSDSNRCLPVSSLRFHRSNSYLRVCANQHRCYKHQPHLSDMRDSNSLLQIGSLLCNRQHLYRL